MSEKIPVSRLAGKVAETAHCDQSTALQFIKDLFAFVEAEVSAGKEVSVPGLGTFAKSSVAGEPISFVPDAEYAAELNADFEMFSPVEINEGVTEEELDSVDDITTTPEAQAPAISENEADKPEATERDEVAEEASAENATVVDTIAEETAPPTEDSKEEAEEEVSTEEAETGQDRQETEIMPVTEVETQVTEITENAPASEAEPSITAIPEQEEEYVIVRTRKSRFWVGFFVGLLIGFAIGVIAFIAYLVNMLGISVENIVN